MIRTQWRALLDSMRRVAGPRAVLAALSLTLCSAAIASGQAFRGTVVGTVTDDTGAVIAQSTGHADGTR